MRSCSYSALSPRRSILSMPPGSAASAFSTTRRLPDPAGTHRVKPEGRLLPSRNSSATITSCSAHSASTGWYPRLPSPAFAGAGSSAFGGALVAVDHSGVDIQGCRLHRPTALQIEDEFGIGLGQTQQRHRLGGDRRLALLQQRQVLGMELR